APGATAEIADVERPLVDRLRDAFREIERLVEDDGRRGRVLTHVVEDGALGATGEDRLGDAFDPDASAPTAAPLVTRDRVERVDLVGPRPLAEAEEDHPRAVRHARIISLLKERVFVRVRRRAHAEDGQLARAVVLQRVPRPGWDQDRVAGTDPPRLAVDLESARALRDEVDLLGPSVIVALRLLLGLEECFREALLCRVMQLADRRAVLRSEGLRAVEALHVHSAEASTSATRSCAAGS